MNLRKMTKETTMKCNIGLLLLGILTNWTVEISCTCILAATIAAIISAPFGILSESKSQQNIDGKSQPRILPKRKPPDKLEPQFLLTNPSWSSKRKRDPDDYFKVYKARLCTRESDRESAVPAPTNEARNKKIKVKAKPWICPKRKPPDKSRSRQFILDENADAASRGTVAFLATKMYYESKAMQKEKPLANANTNDKSTPSDSTS